MPNYNLVNTSSYETLLSELSQILFSIEDDDSTQIINHFDDVTYRETVNYAKDFNDGVFLINGSEEEMQEDSNLTYNTQLDCYLVFQHMSSTSPDFTSDFHKIISLIEQNLEVTTETSGGIPLRHKFEILNITRNSELPEKIMPTENGNPYYVAQFLIRVTRLGY